MKKNLFVLSVVFVLLLFCQVACKKETVVTPDPTYPVTGLWIGTYTGNGITTPRFYSLTVFPDGTILTKGDISTGYAYAKGTWTLSGNTFTASITTFTTPSVVQTITGTFSNTGTLTNATWNDTTNPFGPLGSGDFQNLLRNN
jgi:hypothetical protein